MRAHSGGRATVEHGHGPTSAPNDVLLQHLEPYWTSTITTSVSICPKSSAYGHVK